MCVDWTRELSVDGETGKKKANEREERGSVGGWRKRGQEDVHGSPIADV